MRKTVVFVALCSVFAYANEILFIDFNNAPLEIAAVSAGRSVRVVPTFETINKNTRVAIEKLNLQRERVEKLATHCEYFDSTASCTALAREFGITEKDHVFEFHFQFGKKKRELLEKYGPAELEKDIQSLKPVEYKTIVISGHHTNGYLAGELIDAMQFDAIKKIASNNQHLFSKVKYLAILGCESGQEDIIRRWGQIFPSSQIVVAANGKAPIKTDKGNLVFIRQLMNRIDQLESVGGPKDTFSGGQFLSSIRSSGWPAAVLHKQSAAKYVYSR
jgi:hypothetical protein